MSKNAMQPYNKPPADTNHPDQQTPSPKMIRKKLARHSKAPTNQCL
jgi:ribosomal protein S24E